MNQLHIAFGRAEDIAFIAQFQVDMAWESEGTRLDGEQVMKGVTHAIDDPQKGKYVVAFVDGVPVGSLMLTREWSDWTDRWYLWIQSVYVLPEHRGRGIYRAMYAWVKVLAQAEGITQIRLYVDCNNHRAQHVYRQVGMKESHYQMYEEDV